MKSFDVQTMDKVGTESSNPGDPIERILKRQSERKKEEKNSEDVSNIDEIQRFIDNFNNKQNKIEKALELTESMEREKLSDHFSDLNNEIQELQKFYSNSTFFLRIYDKKICQKSLHSLQVKLQDTENRLLPKKKFGFKARKNKVENVDIKNGDDKVDSVLKIDKSHLSETCGFHNRTDEVLLLEEEKIEKKDVLLSDLKNCTIKLLGAPTTLHIANLDSCAVQCGPVATSVFIEHAKDSKLQLACQQLRIHNTTNTDFYIHVTSRAIIEDSTEIRFGIYGLKYDDLDKHYQISGLNKNINNWDKVDDFNWLASDKPSPNWSKLLASDNQS